MKIIFVFPLGTSFHDLINLFTRIDLFVHQFRDILLRPSFKILTEPSGSQRSPDNKVATLDTFSQDTAREASAGKEKFDHWN